MHSVRATSKETAGYSAVELNDELNNYWNYPDNINNYENPALTNYEKSLVTCCIFVDGISTTMRT